MVLRLYSFQCFEVAEAVGKIAFAAVLVAVGVLVIVAVGEFRMVAVGVAVAGTGELVGVAVRGALVALGDLVGGADVKVGDGTAVGIRVTVATGRGVAVGEFIMVT